MISNVDQLIEQANLIENETDRVNFVMNYFLQTVQYNYGYLLAYGYLQGTISNVDFKGNNEKPLLSKNPFSKGKITINVNGEQKEFDDSLCTTVKITDGESALFDKVVELSNSCGGNKDEFILQLYDLFVNELSKHINNDNIVSQNVFDIVSKYKQSMNLGDIRKSEKGEFFITPDIKKVMICFMLYPQRYMPSIIENGLMKKGVCENYADYFAELLPKIGISCIRIDGTSELGHAWNAAIVDGKLKSIDLTRAIFIRDNWNGIPEEQKSEDWLLADFPDTFRWQSTRSIQEAGLDENHKPIPLGYIVNGTNFNEESLTDLVIKYSKRLEGRERK